MRIDEVMFFDIETVPVEEQRILDIVYPEPEKPTVEEAPVNYGEEAKLRWTEKRLETLKEKREKNLRSAALDIDSAKIRSIAWAIGEEEIKCSIGNEVQVLKDFLSAWNNHKARRTNVSCGYNLLNYDWSVIMRRIVMLNHEDLTIISPPNMNRYSGELDLMNVAYNFGYAAGRRKSLKELAMLLGIEVPAKDVSGADVADLSDKELKEYNISDVYITREIFKKLNGVYF